jgi:hypothetical protein
MEWLNPDEFRTLAGPGTTRNRGRGIPPLYETLRGNARRERIPGERGAGQLVTKCA